VRAKDIIKESIKVLIAGSFLSSLGGFSLEIMKEKFSSLIPLVIILPALASMIGNAGIILVSKITTYLNNGELKERNLNNKIVRKLFYILMSVFILTAVYATFLSVFIGMLKGFDFSWDFTLKMLAIILMTTIFIVFVVFCIALIGSRYAFKRNIDPDDLLIPITTSIADFGSFILFSALVYLIF
jgi:mgtE-like transporter